MAGVELAQNGWRKLAQTSGPKMPANKETNSRASLGQFHKRKAAWLPPFAIHTLEAVLIYGTRKMAPKPRLQACPNPDLHRNPSPFFAPLKKLCYPVLPFKKCGNLPLSAETQP
jgi:hypothetical protein